MIRILKIIEVMVQLRFIRLHQELVQTVYTTSFLKFGLCLHLNRFVLG